MALKSFKNIQSKAETARVDNLSKRLSYAMQTKKQDDSIKVSPSFSIDLGYKSTTERASSPLPILESFNQGPQWKENSKLFLSHIFINHNFPTKPSSKKQYINKNGKKHLVISTPGQLPYGADMKYVMAICQLSVTQQAQVLTLASAKGFLELISLSAHNDNRKRLKKGLKRLLEAHFSYIDRVGDKVKTTKFRLLEEVSYDGHQIKIVLSKDFYEHLNRGKNLRALDGRMLELLKRNLIDFNMYKFTAHRTQMGTDARIKVDEFMAQMGSAATHQKYFVKDFKEKRLTKIQQAFLNIYQMDFPKVFSFTSDKRKKNFVIHIHGGHQLLPKKEATNKKSLLAKVKSLIQKYGVDAGARHLSSAEHDFIKKELGKSFYHLGKLSEWEFNRILKT